MSDVLVKTRNWPPYGVYHEPDPDNPDRPKCDHNGRKGIEFRRVSKEAVSTYRVCKMCTDQVDRTHGGKHLATVLSDMDPEEV